jgi:hypothetical protein
MLSSRLRLILPNRLFLLAFPPKSSMHSSHQISAHKNKEVSTVSSLHYSNSPTAHDLVSRQTWEPNSDSPTGWAPNSHLCVYNNIAPNCNCFDYSSVGIAMGYGLRGRGIRVQFPTRTRDVSILHSAQLRLGAHLAFYTLGTRGFFLGINRPGRGGDHWSPTNAENSNGAVTLLCPILCSLRFYVNNLKGRSVGSIYGRDLRRTPLR